MVDKARGRGRRLGDRLRGDPQQLLPAGDVGADGGLRGDLGVRSRRRSTTTAAATSRSGPSVTGARAGRGLRAPAADRLSLRAAHRRAARSRAHMRELCPATGAREGLTVCLHEHAGGFAFNIGSRCGAWRDKARAAGARDRRGGRGDRLRARRLGRGEHRVETSAGPIEVEQVVIAVGPWIPHLWEMLGLPDRLDVRRPDGSVDADVADVDLLVPAGGRGGAAALDPRRRRRPRPRRCFTSTPTARCATTSGRLVSEEQWGIYVKPDRDSVQGGAQPLTVGESFEVDPYPTGTVEPDFPDLWCAALSHCMERFEGCRSRYRQVRSGGAGAFTADNFPVFDRMLPNVYVAADSNHGYKMIAVGREIARELGGEHSLAAAPVPLRALLDRRPSPGLAEPLPVEPEVQLMRTPPRYSCDIGSPSSVRRGGGTSRPIPSDSKEHSVRKTGPWHPRTRCRFRIFLLVVLPGIRAHDGACQAGRGPPAGEQRPIFGPRRPAPHPG